MTPLVATTLGVALLLAVSGVRGCPTARPAGSDRRGPGRLFALALGLISPAAAVRRVDRLAPTIAFLAAVLVIAHLVEADGVFRWLGAVLADRSRGSAKRLLRWFSAPHRSPPRCSASTRRWCC